MVKSYSARSSSPLAVDCLTRVDALLTLEAEWRALEPSLPALPFNRFDWAVSWWRAFGRTTLKRRNQLRLLTFRRPSGALVGIAPMMLTSWPAHGPVRARTLQFFGNDPNLTELRGPAFHVEHADECFAALFAELAERSRSWDWLRLSGLPAECELRSFEALPLTRGAERDTPNYVLELPESWERLKSGLSRNTKEAIRKCYNAPKRDGVELTFHVVTDGPALEGAFARFLRLHAGRAERTGTVPHPNVFARAEAREFLERAGHAFARQGRLRVFELRRHGEVVASRIGFALGDTLYLYYSGYDAELARYSVMTRLVCESLRYALQQGFRRVNLSTGTDGSKLRWGPVKTVSRDVELVSNALTSRALHGAFTWTARVLNGKVLPYLRAEAHELRRARPNEALEEPLLEDIAAQ